MTTLKHKLITRILHEGPLSVADYMATCLLHPTLGFYTTRDPLGRGGDFTTSPEISQMFGELIGLWVAQIWMDQGAPNPFVLAELGPGRGSLMADALRATRTIAGFHDALRLHLVETSPVLRDMQHTAMSAFAPRFHDHIGDLPQGPLYLIANEFFDTLPIRQFQRTVGGWRERHIGARNDALIWGLGPDGPVPALTPRLHDTKPDQIVEIGTVAGGMVGEIGARVASFGGAAIIIDYGDWNSLGDTFQAVKNHEYVDPLATPGQADLSAHVAFGPLARAAAPAVATPLTPPHRGTSTIDAPRCDGAPF